MAKPYGLVLPNKAKLTSASEIKKPSIFDEDSDSDEEDHRPTGITKTLKRQDRVAIEKAVEEDPTVYQYDEVYDEIDQKRKESKMARSDADKQPKYIIRLLAAAEKRKRENERRIERQVQKEREAEGDEFRDKESFVTSAYRKKLEEFKRMEEEEKREEYLERIGDVTKQGNLDGFYRHLYDQKVNYEDGEKEETKGDEDKAEDATKIKPPTSQKRRYRRRESSSSSDGNGEAQGDDRRGRLEHLPSNLDADSDFSIDSDSSDGETEGDAKKMKTEGGKEEDKPEVNAENGKKEAVETEKEAADQNGAERRNSAEATVEEKPKRPKIDIWKKRTVGVVFDEALRRYFERKALREAAAVY